MKYYDYKEDTELECSKCGWKGPMKDAASEGFDDFLDVRCPIRECDAPILKLLYPTKEETLDAAMEGNRAAQLDAMGEMCADSMDAHYKTLEAVAKKLVMERIKGHRKGLADVPAYQHSIRVYELMMALMEDDMESRDAYLAVLLHDIIEDGGVSYGELSELGFSANTIELIRLCTHEETNLGKDARWTLMIAKLITANNGYAWLIKIADLLDNLKESAGLSEERRKFMIEVKAPLILQLTKDILGGRMLWNALRDEVDKMKI